MGETLVLLLGRCGLNGELGGLFDEHAGALELELVVSLVPPQITQSKCRPCRVVAVEGTREFN